MTWREAWRKFGLRFADHGAVVREARRDLSLMPIAELYLRRAAVESVVREMQAKGDARWDAMYKDGRVSPGEQLRLLNDELGRRVVGLYPPVVINTRTVVPQAGAVETHGGQHGRG